MTTVAAIDCGTNSIKLLVAELGHGTLEVVLRDSRVVRLGQRVDETGVLAQEALERTFAAVDEFAGVIRDHGIPAERIRFCATSATRDASNAAVFAEGVRRRLGVEPEVLSGDEEAALVFAGAIAAQDPMPPEPVLVVDIGGGSTELVLGEGEERQAISMNIGSVRLHERHLHSDPPTEAEVAACVADIDRHLDGSGIALDRTRTAIGTSGTIKTLACGVLELGSYDRDAFDHAVLSNADTAAFVDSLLAMTVEERRDLPYMHAGRADVIGADDLVALLLLLFIIVTGFVVEGLRIADTELAAHPGWAPWSPGGYVLALMFSGMSDAALRAAHQAMWWLHLALVVGSFVYVALYFSRLFHIIWGPVNIFFRNMEAPGALVPIDLEKAESFGVSKIEGFNWKQLLDLDSCTRCGRCQDACPAFTSGKPLNPKKVIQDLKGNLYDLHPILLGRKPVETKKDMITDVITDEVIWDCTTCRACDQVCPEYIEHIDKVIDMRRHLAMERCEFPASVQEALSCLEKRAHPYRGTTHTRTDWADGLGIKPLSEEANVDVLYWVGCSAALEDRNTKVSQATAKVMQAAGIKFGILGIEESCCGDPARRLGNEYLYQTLAQGNIEIMNNYKVKKIVTSCPHCYNSLKHEYPQFGGKFEVVHHTQFIAELIQSGKIKLGSVEPKTIAYHDSCYLGRYNEIYQPPRDILKATGGIKAVELPRHGAYSFCCGGGGGHMWMEEDPNKRVNTRRIEEVLDAKVNAVATACPYCLSMFEDALKAKGAEESVKAMDLSELVLQSMKKEK